MKSLTLAGNAAAEDDFGLRAITLAVNADGHGVFVRGASGQWSQWIGTGQTPAFDDPQQFRRWLAREYPEVMKGRRVIEKEGW